MTDYTDILYLGSSPAEEMCFQVGTEDYARNAKAECRLYIEAIRKVCGHEPEGARLSVISEPHDFGTYYEVAVRFDGDNEAAADYAYKCEQHSPRTWEEAGIEPPVNRGNGR